jgi:hypothetical protein
LYTFNEVFVKRRYIFLVSYTILSAMIRNTFAFEAIRESAVADSAYVGTLDDVVEQCALVDEQGIEDATFWYPARLARAAIDGTMDNPDRVDLIRNSVAFATNAYAGYRGGREFNYVAARLLNSLGYEHPIVQVQDLLSSASTSPERSQATAQAIAEAGDAPILQLPLCHGGFVTGIQTHLYLGELREVDDKLYPVRYSQLKMGDNAPYLSEDEQNYLASLTNRRVVITTDAK